MKIEKKKNRLVKKNTSMFISKTNDQEKQSPLSFYNESTDRQTENS